MITRDQSVQFGKSRERLSAFCFSLETIILNEHSRRSMIHIDNISFRYSPDKWVISNLDFRIAYFSWTVITGPDASGKTTLAKLIKGLLNPQRGSVSFTDSRRSLTDQIGFLCGNSSSSIVGITVLDDICFGMENLRVSQSEMRKRVETVLRWTGLTGFENRLTHTLSGGERQKLALAGALAIGNKILILDEAFSMLDNVSRNDARDLVRDLKGKLDLTIIEMTNRAREISSADMIFFLGPGGKLEFAGPPVQFLFSALGSEWTAPQGGLYGLLSALPGEEINQVENLIGQLGIRLA